MGFFMLRSFLDGLIQKNDKIISTKASISNMRSKPHDKSHNDDKRSPKPKHKKSHDIKAMKINIIKEQNRGENKANSKNDKRPPKCKVCEKDHYTVLCEEVPIDLKEVSALFKILIF